MPSKKIAEAKQRSTPILRLHLNSGLGLKGTSRRAFRGGIPQNPTEAGKTRDGKLASEHGQYPDHNNVLGIWTCVLLIKRHLAQAESLGGACGEFMTLLKTVACSGKYGADCRSISKGLPRDHLPILLTQRYTLQPHRREAATALSGGKWDLQAIADCLQQSSGLFATVVSSLEKAKPKFEALREDPTPDAHWALWVDCMREPARTFFSLHRTPKWDDAQT